MVGLMIVITQTVGIAVLSLFVLAAMVAGIICLWSYGRGNEHNPNAVTICPCCGQPDDKCYCNAC